MDNLERILKLTAALLAIVVPIILLAGYSYHLGYVMTFGLSVELIPKYLTDVLVESWYVGVTAIAWLLTRWSYFLVLFIVFCLYCFGVLLFFVRAKKRGNTSLFEELSKENQGKTIIGITQWQWTLLGQLFRTSFMWLFAPLFLTAIIVSFTVNPYQLGKKEATRKIEAFKLAGCDGKNEAFTCIYLVDISSEQNDIVAQGILVSANQDRIAIFNDGLEVRPLLERYVIREHVAK